MSFFHDGNRMRSMRGIAMAVEIKEMTRKEPAGILK